MDISKITTYQSGVAQSAAYRNLHKLFSGMLKPYGLTSMQWFVLGTISDNGDIGVQLTALAAQLQTGLPFITNTINMLEQKGMVERRGNPLDSRSKSVYITDTFRPRCLEIEADLRRQMRLSIYSSIEPDDLKTYIKVLYLLSHLRLPD